MMPCYDALHTDELYVRHHKGCPYRGLAPIISYHITAPLCSFKTGIPVHRALGQEGSAARLHRYRDLIARDGIIGLYEVLQDECGDINGKAAMSNQRDCLSEGTPLFIDYRAGDRFCVRCRILQ